MVQVVQIEGKGAWGAGKGGGGVEVILTKSKRTPTFFGETFPNLPFKAVHDSSKSDLVDRFDDLVNNDNNNDNYNDKTSFVKYFYA